jgi:hypothetical protein
MSMPGGSSYEVCVVKVNHVGGSDTVDSDIGQGMEVLADPLLYAGYLEQLGLVSALENEQHVFRQSRGKRRNKTNTRFLEQSPCLPDINFGLLRRVAVALGVSTVGGKVQILSNIQEYVPVTFGLAMFAIGDHYTDITVQLIVDKLLVVAPSRRQPEACH